MFNYTKNDVTNLKKDRKNKNQTLYLIRASAITNLIEEESFF